MKPSLRNPQTGKPANLQTPKLPNPQTGKPANRQTPKPPNPQTGKPANLQTPKTSTSLSTADLTADIDLLRRANQDYSRRYPGDPGARQPVHTVYGGAHLFQANAAAKLGAAAVAAWERYAPNPSILAGLLASAGAASADSLAETIHQRVARKLENEPIEDFRIDFEDGFGNRPDSEEDFHASRAAGEVARGMEAGILPPFLGIRIKPLSEELYSRSLRTLDIFLTALLAGGNRELPGNFVVTLPKIPIPEQVACLARVLAKLESKLSLSSGALKMELMIELTQSLFDHEGRFNLPLLLEAAEGRCVAAHFGTYDYTASRNITAAYQEMTHPACDFAKELMQVAYSGTGLWLSDGATNILPVPPFREREGAPLTEDQIEENRRVVHDAWKVHIRHVFHSLRGGFYQGWDLHPNQLPTRYAAIYAFFLESRDVAAERLTNFINKAAQATLVGDVFDDAATGQGLLNYFLRGINCGAITLDEALQTGLTLEEIRGRSFLQILKNRRGR